MEDGYIVSYDLLHKFLIVGDSGVGKSCFLNRFVLDNYTQLDDNGFISQKHKYMNYDDKILKLDIWDIMQRERFDLANSFFRGSHGVFIVYDVTEEDSYKNIGRWLTAIQKFGNVNANIIIVGNKIDETSRKKVNFNKAREFANSMGITMLEVSAKYSINVDLAFSVMVSEIRKRILDGQDISLTSTVRVTHPETTTTQSSCVCL